ncbi:MAG: hypothetical protein ABIU29_05120 [Chthoniobacterales bacterium]
MKHWEQLADNVALLQFPLRAFGIDFRRNVTLLRLRDGRIVIHSTAPFETKDVEAICRFGQPGWLVDVTLMHNTFAKAGRTAFPELPYLAPAGFSKTSGLATKPLLPAPNDWAGEIEVIAIDGLRYVGEHALFHRASGTLVLGDLLFHFPAETRGWPRFFAHHLMRLPRMVGMSAFFRLMIRDKELFAASMRQLLEFDFQRIVVGHSEPIRHRAKAALQEAMRARDLSG